jgi:hypothetical protein
VQFATVMMPSWGTIPVHEDNVPLEGTTGLNVIGVVAAVTTLFAMSSTTRAGGMAKTEPDFPATGDVVNNNCVAMFVMLKAVLVAGVKPLDDAVRVSEVPHWLP